MHETAFETVRKLRGILLEGRGRTRGKIIICIFVKEY